MHAEAKIIQSRSQSRKSGRLFTWDDLWSEKEVSTAFGDSWLAIQHYLQLTKETESPRQYHLWNILFLASAIGASNAWVDHGRLGRIRLNMGVVLCGRPTIRKSSSIAFMRRFAEQFNLNFGPTDVGGARHGVMAAMQSRWQSEFKQHDDSKYSGISSIEDLASANFDEVLSVARTRYKSSHVVFAVNELGRLLTAQTRELLDFFKDGLDNEAIYYQTKNGSIRIQDPLISLIGAITPLGLTLMLPRDAGDHSILSRLIFVYASNQAKAVPLPLHDNPREEFLWTGILEILRRIESQATGPIHLSAEAAEEYIRLYDHTVASVEFRLAPYSGMRQIHLLKVAASICLLRGSAPYEINLNDIRLAHLILMLTELQMDGPFAALDKTIEGKALTHIRDMIEMENNADGAIAHDIPFIILQKLGFSEDESTKIYQRLQRSGRIAIKDSRLSIATNLGADLARIYFNSCLPPEHQQGLF